MIITCNHCGKEFKSRSKKRKYCCFECSVSARTTTWPIYTCGFCGGSFKRNPHQAHRVEYTYCSHKCYTKAKRKSSFQTCTYCGEQFYPHPRGQTFCSDTCRLNSLASKRVTKVCPGCNNSFTVKPATAYRYTFCSVECRAISKGGKYIKCKRCGKQFLHQGTDIARGLNRSYCSEECRRPSHTINCANCETEFRVTPSNLSQRRFCSFACYRDFKGETSIERKTRSALNELGLYYVQEFPPDSAKYSVDFAIPARKIAIEVDGVYWHNSEKDARKDATLEQNGWCVVRITETEINNAKSLTSLLRNRLKPITDLKATYLCPFFESS